MGFLFMKNIIKIVCVIIGALIGAGFASGQEIYIFFFSHGIKGLIGILVSSTLIGIVIYKVLNIVKQNDIRTYKEFLDVIIKIKEKSKYLNIKYIINLVINIFILITFFIMIAGFGAYFEQEFGINSIIGSSILAILSLIIFMTSVKGVIKANEILIPILIVFIILIGFINIKEIKLLELEKYIIKISNGNWIFNAILYSSYNSILLVPVLITLKDYIKNKKSTFLIGLITTIITILLSVIMFLLLVRIDVDITKLEMPAVYVVSKMFSFIRIIYGFIILASIFTTSISLGTSFLQNVSKNKKSYTQIAIIMCIIAVGISKIGFSNLVNLLYPVFGYLGLIQISRLLTMKKVKLQN